MCTLSAEKVYLSLRATVRPHTYAWNTKRYHRDRYCHIDIMNETTCCRCRRENCPNIYNIEIDKKYFVLKVCGSDEKCDK